MRYHRSPQLADVPDSHRRARKPHQENAEGDTGKRAKTWAQRIGKETLKVKEALGWGFERTSKQEAPKGED